MRRSIEDIVRELENNLRNPEQYRFDQHVHYFTQEFVVIFKGLKNVNGEIENQILTILRPYINYLTQSISSQVTIQQYAYLISGLNKLLSMQINNSVFFPELLESLFPSAEKVFAIS